MGTQYVHPPLGWKRGGLLVTAHKWPRYLGGHPNMLEQGRTVFIITDQSLRIEVKTEEIKGGLLTTQVHTSEGSADIPLDAITGVEIREEARGSFSLTKTILWGPPMMQPSPNKTEVMTVKFRDPRLQMDFDVMFEQGGNELSGFRARLVSALAEAKAQASEEGIYLPEVLDDKQREAVASALWEDGGIESDDARMRASLAPGIIYRSVNRGRVERVRERLEELGFKPELRGDREPPAAKPTSGASDLVTQLAELARLKEQGALTEEEFQKAKARLLG